MRRRILEWTLWLSITAFLGVISLEAASFLDPPFRELRRGRNPVLTPFFDRAGSTWPAGWTPILAIPTPMIVNPRNIVAPKATRSGSVNLPGFSLTFCLFRSNPAIWSARISLFVPLVLSLFTIAIVFYRLKRLQSRTAPSSTAIVTSHP